MSKSFQNMTLKKYLTVPYITQVYTNVYAYNVCSPLPSSAFSPSVVSIIYDNTGLSIIQKYQMENSRSNQPRSLKFCDILSSQENSMRNSNSDSTCSVQDLSCPLLWYTWCVSVTYWLTRISD